MSTAFKRILGCLITLALIVYGVRKLDYVLRPTDTDRAYAQIDNFHSLPKDSVEVMFYGSSRVYRGIDPMEMYKNYGIGAYNYGSSGSFINTTKLFVYDSLLTQSPKLAIIETSFANRVLRNTDLNGQIFYTRYLNADSARRRYLKQCFGDDLEGYLSFYMPLCAFHDAWCSLTSTSFLPIGSDETLKTYRDNMGYHESDYVKAVTLPDQAGVEQKELNKYALGELDEIVGLLRSNGADVLFYTVPSEDQYAYSDAMKAYAEKNGLVYLNLFEHLEETGLDPRKDFMDTSHLNVVGARKVANYLGAYVSQHYRLTDMRQIDGNPWERAMALAAADE